jgi:S1-C subfamily serine protease
MTEPFARPRTSPLTPILAGAALVIAGYLVLDRAGAFRPAAKGEPRPVAARGDLAEFEKASIGIFEANKPSVVHITIQARRGRFDMDAGTGSGSGLVWDDQGHIVTNYHVIRDHDQYGGRMVVRFADRGEHTAYVVMGDPAHDIAVLRLADNPRDLRPVKIGTSADLRVGQSVFAIGNPFGLDLTFTTGVVSALDRSISTRDRAGVPLYGMIQTDAAINPGNSGGPLFDSAGRLIGMNTAIVSQSGGNAGLGFAVPVDVINTIVPDLIEKRPPPRAVVGVLLHERPIAVPQKTGHSYAVAITSVTPGYGAQEAGVEPVQVDASNYIVSGDAILALNGTPVESSGEAINLLKGYVPGNKVKVQLYRYRPGKEPVIETVEITLKEFAAR